MAELSLGTGDWSGLRVLRLQAGSGADALDLAGRGAVVVGIDPSLPTVLEARRTAEAAGLVGRVRFVHAEIADARHTLPDPEGFDVVVMPDLDSDVEQLAAIAEWFLRPGGTVLRVPAREA